MLKGGSALNVFPLKWFPMHSTNLGLHNESLALGLERSVRQAGRGSILTDRTSLYIVVGLFIWSDIFF